MESIAGLIKLEKGYEKDFNEWREALNTRKDEALESIRREKVEIECWFHIEVKDEPYLLWFIRVESMEKAREVFLNSEFEIDIIHKDKMEKMQESGIEANLVAELCAI